ncbi:MAG: dTMP kinase [Pelagibacteraceae bacterium]|nr:dTMP kinase [Pelagibacteraceae bacterium]|tara:strand:+ start:3036 stop:3653 length:618 start_codon:yes stop_codon:yes gene_type:complete
MNKKGLFITLEGGEATGKTTQIKKIRNWLKENKLPHLITREPGGTNTAEKIRKIILSKNKPISIETEVFLIMAARIEHINSKIIPALKKGKIVICDRFVDSTAVYQGFYNSFGINEIYKLHKSYLNNFLPKLTFFFDADLNITKSRIRKRKNRNKYDMTNDIFNKKIKRGYYKVIKSKRRFKIINASLSEKEVFKSLIKEIKKII